jgi:hypothetical protein
VIGNHLLAERLDLIAGAFRFGKLAGVDIDLIGGTDNVSDLRIARPPHSNETSSKPILSTPSTRRPNPPRTPQAIWHGANDATAAIHRKSDRIKCSDSAGFLDPLRVRAQRFLAQGGARDVHRRCFAELQPLAPKCF